MIDLFYTLLQAAVMATKLHLQTHFEHKEVSMNSYSSIGMVLNYGKSAMLLGCRYKDELKYR